MTLQPGTRLGSYEITSPLGSGGMGQVYKAKDLKLDRDVAVKVLREDLASDPERLRRFEQEARAASGLNHPNIIHIYDIDMHGSTPYIAMEYVEGNTLQEILSEGPLPIERLLNIATQGVVDSRNDASRLTDALHHDVLENAARDPPHLAEEDSKEVQ